MFPLGILIVFNSYILISLVISSVRCSSTAGICKICSQLGLLFGFTYSSDLTTICRSFAHV